MPRISVVTSLYRAGPYVREFHRRSSEALAAIPGDHELLFVDDGSPDNAREEVLHLIDQDPRVRLVELSRNYGQHRALWIGLQQSRGELVFMVDADLEEDPALVEKFYALMQERHGEIDVVYGVMEKRKGGSDERLGGQLFYWLINRLSDVPLPANVLNARLMTRDYVNALLSYKDAEPFLGVLMALAGFRQLAVPCPKSSKGESSYTFSRKMRLALDAIFAMGTKPTRWLVWGGLWVSAIGFVGLIAALIQGAGAAALTLASVWFFAGALLAATGVVGAYVARVLTQTRGRPVALIRRIYEANPK